MLIFAHFFFIGVEFGNPQRKARPWNSGGKSGTTSRSLSGKVTALDHQSILISSIWMAGKDQCSPAEVKGICYYSQQDVSVCIIFYFIF